MFTGLIQGQGEIERLARRGNELEITVRLRFAAGELSVGESIAVNGVCLTAESVGPNRFTAYASAETAARSTFSALKTGDAVNVEQALRLGDRLGGHLVSGHVDGVARVLEVNERGASREVWFEFPGDLAAEIAAKGSVCLDGISLTVNACEETRFSVNIIPETWRETTAAGWRPGARVNLETDVLAKYVARCLGLARLGKLGKAESNAWEEAPPDGQGDVGRCGAGPKTARNRRGLTLDFLREHGF